MRKLYVIEIAGFRYEVNADNFSQVRVADIWIDVDEFVGLLIFDKEMAQLEALTMLLQ